MAKSAPSLTRNESLIFSMLEAAQGPLKAYDLLERLKPEGVRAPMTVYRALDGLTAKGLVHKVDALNAFVLCAHAKKHAIQIFFICDVCGAAEEAKSAEVEPNLGALAGQLNFDVRLARLEVQGLCARCEEARSLRSSA